MTRIFGLLLLLFSFLSCENEHIRQVRIDLLNDVSSDQGTVSTTGYLFSDEIIYNDFSLDNYPDVSSVVLVANLRTTHPDHECMLELFNLTDSEAIRDSRISTANLGRTWVESGNLAGSFPDHPVDLTISLISGFPGLSVYVSSAYLYITME